MISALQCRGNYMQKREEYLRNAALRTFEWANQHQYERDFELDRHRGRHGYHRDHLMQEARHFMDEGIGGWMKMIAKYTPPFHLADVLIGILRGAIEIGRPKTQSEFKKPERVKELATITYLSPQQQNAQKVAMKIPYPFAVIDPKKAFFNIDCVA